VEALQIQALQIQYRKFQPYIFSATNSVLLTQRYKLNHPQLQRHKFLTGHSDRSRPTLFPLVRPRTSRPAKWRNLSSIPRASRAQIFPATVRLIFTFRLRRQSYQRLFPVALRNLCIPVNLIRLRIGAPFVRAGRLPLCRFLVASRLWHNFRFGTERFLNGFHHDASFSLQI
jgi:hypothetical protein